MCVKLMSQVFDLDMPTGRKFVLLAFADAANDDGVTWIAVQSERGKRDIRKKCSMGLRTVQGHIKDLEREGHLERVEEVGKGCLWIVRATPAGFAGVWASTPAEFAPTPAGSAGEPSLTVKEEKKPERLCPPVDKCPVSSLPLPAGLSLAQWEAFLDMRFALGKKVSLYVAGLLLQKLAKMATKWVAGDVVDRSTANGWPDLYEPEENRVTGVRRVAAGFVADPVGGLSDEDKAELIRISNMERFEDQIVARREFYARQDRRNTPASIGRLVGELNLGPPAARKPGNAK